jgi:hypothetical protein
MKIKAVNGSEPSAMPPDSRERNGSLALIRVQQYVLRERGAHVLRELMRLSQDRTTRIVGHKRV